MLALLIILVAIMLLKWFIIPIKILNHYETLFKLKGFKTMRIPYRPYTAPFFDEHHED